MRFQPLFGWWLVLPLVVVGLAGVGWQIYLLQRSKKRKIENRKRQLVWLLRGILLILIALMTLGPSVPGGVTSPGISNIDVLFAVDTTASMGAQDYRGQQLRIEGVRQDMLAIGSKLKGAHFGIVTFDSNADPLLPFTADYATFTGAVQSIDRELYNTSNGSSIDKGLDLITKQLKNSKAAYPDRSRMLFYMGDGEQTVKQSVKSFKGIAGLLDGGAVLGYGTAKGAKMVKHSGLEAKKAKPTYILTPDPSTHKLISAISKLDESALKKIASDTKLSYKNRNNAGSIDSLISDSNAPVLIDRGKRIVHYLNLYWLIAIPFAALLLWEWKAIVTQLLMLRRSLKEQSHV